MPNNVSRKQVCELASRKLRDAAPSLARRKAVLGLDGFVDEIIAVVDKRLDGERYDAVRSIAEMSRKVSLASGQSANYELIVKQRKLGGNGPIMATALAAAGMGVTYIGNLGVPTIDPVFEPLASRATVISIGQPAHTDALEFEDGKLMLGKLTPLNEVTWDNILAKVGREKLKGYLDSAELIGMVNWTMLPHMTRIWGSLLDEIVPNAERHSRKLFIDLADPEKRKHEDIIEALKLLQRFQDQVDVILGLNLKESLEVADVLGLARHLEEESAIEDAAAAIRAKLNLACVVIHPRRSAHAATASEVASFQGPFVKQPKISTGAGDHFNAGFCMARVLGLSLQESLCAGVASSGYYVRTAESPTILQLADFVANLPDPQ
jgi:sugar/nucleoside kinase (ribokinase family)